MISKDLEHAIASAVNEAKKRRHEYLSLEHILYSLLQEDSGVEIITHCGGDLDTLRRELESFFDNSMESVPGAEDYVLEQTVGFQRVLQRAVGQVQSSGKKQVEVGDILAALFFEKDSHALYFLKAQGISRLDVLNFISHGISKVLDGEPLEDLDAPRAKPSRKKAGSDPLEAYCINLLEKARKGKIDPIIGREVELIRTQQVLLRRRKNNPVFVGEPGVGKTALAEGLALLIHNHQVPGFLQDAEMYALDLGGMLAGTKFRGEFEERLKAVVNALIQKKNAILVIDEIHTVVGAGATSGGSMDASNILKPFLAMGELRCIGSSTYEEYKNHFEKDRALSRRFEKIEIAEPSVDETVAILEGLRSRYEEHHGISYTRGAIRACVTLAAKHLNDRFLPDKAIDVMDEAGAALRMNRQTKRRYVRPRDIEHIIAKMARIPEKSVSSSERDRLEVLEPDLKKVVFGQDHAIGQVTSAIQRSRAGLGDPRRPVGCFLFVGPTGVGKTEVAVQLAKTLGISFIRFDMSEYMEKHAVARLIGAPPGYVGFDQGGLLTDQVTRHPHSVLLLDEMEKAHPDVFNIMLQVMDHATLTDHNGRKADFRNVIIIMTSNAGARDMDCATIGFGDPVKDAGRKGEKAVEKAFSPEFRNRLDAIVSFCALDLSIMEMIVDKYMAELSGQLAARKVTATLTPQARKYLAQKGHDPKFGARPLGRLMQTELKDPLAAEMLFGKLRNGGLAVVDRKGDKLAFSFPVKKESKASAKKTATKRKTEKAKA
ncbi:MAG: ATP-dependent Clp protease ATP-binding subunit ClpA [Thermodesulfobacteriota bacterium]